MSSPYTLRVHCEDITPGASGGIENFAVGMARGFMDALGADRVSILAAAGTADAWTARLGDSAPVTEVTRFGASPGGIVGGLAWRVLRRSRAAARVRAHLRHMSSPAMEGAVADYFPFHRARTYGRRRFLTVHDLRVFVPEYVDGPSQRNITANVMTAEAVFTSWRHPFKDIAQRFPHASEKLFEVPFPAMLPPSTTAPRTRGDFLLFPAATIPHKNHRLLVRYLSEFPDAPPVVCVGPEVEPGFSELRAAVAARGVGDRLQVRGMVSAEDLDRLYDTCLAVVMPTLHEAASGPVMEAFCRGVPVVGADIPALRDQMAQCGGDVSWFDPASPASLADAVQRLQASYEELATAARAGGAWYSGLSWQNTARGYARVIDAKMGSA